MKLRPGVFAAIVLLGLVGPMPMPPTIIRRGKSRSSYHSLPAPAPIKSRGYSASNCKTRWVRPW